MSNSSNNNWGEYSKLVLAELERHNKWLNKIDEKINKALIVFELEKQALEQVTSIVRDLDRRVEELEVKSTASESVDQYKAETQVWKRWFVGLLLPAAVGIVFGIETALNRGS